MKPSNDNVINFSKHIDHVEYHDKGTLTSCLFDARLMSDFSPHMFGNRYWKSLSAITGSSQGRGTTWFVKHQHKNQRQDWVLRHYFRGGLIGKFNKDHYIFTSLEKTRAFKEFKLLHELQQLNLPAPAPVACQVVKKGLWYQADLLSERITNARDLVSLLSKKAVGPELFKNIGATIQRFHKAGIYHHDLNIHNILIDNSEKVWIIDFDQGDKRKVDKRWQQLNMARLLRSFRKEKTKLATLNWQEVDWRELMEGYLSS